MRWIVSSYSICGMKSDQADLNLRAFITSEEVAGWSHLVSREPFIRAKCRFFVIFLESILNIKKPLTNYVLIGQRFFLMVGPTGFEPDFSFPYFASIYIQRCLSATCRIVDLQLDESKCIVLKVVWQITGKSRIKDNGLQVILILC